MPLVRVTPDFPLKGPTKIPVGSGRTIRFRNHRDEQCVSEKELRSVGGMFVVVGECEQRQVVYTSSRPETPCSPCQEKKMTAVAPVTEEVEGMKCDFMVDRIWDTHVRYRCIRCDTVSQIMKKNVWVSGRCKNGLGDWVYAVTHFLGIAYCSACSERRRLLNEFHRRWYRKLRGPHGATYLEKHLGEAPATTAGWCARIAAKLVRFYVARRLLPKGIRQSQRRK